MSDMDVWRAAAAQLVGDSGEVVTDPSAVAPAPVEQSGDDDYDLPEIAPVSQDVLDDLGDDDDEPTVTPSYSVNEEDDEYVDDETRKLRTELRRAQKQLENERKQRAESNIVNWRDKYRKMYPLADVEGINATSRRAFERQAILSHNKNYEVLKPHIEAFKVARGELQNETVSEERARVQQAWGKPTTGPGASDHKPDRTEAWEKSRKESKTLAQHFRNMIAIEDESRRK